MLPANLYKKPSQNKADILNEINSSEDSMDAFISDIIGQTKSAFNFRECMDQQKVLLINLSKGRIGGINAQLLGLIAVSKINQAAMARADMEAKDRKDLYFYVNKQAYNF